MIKNNKLTLVQPVMYQIKIPGNLAERQSDWDDRLEIRVETDHTGNSISTLTGKFDQAALHGMLRRLYSLGLPLISAIYVEAK